MNNQTRICAVAALLLFPAVAAMMGNALAQDGNGLAGTYTAAVNAQFGDKVRGQLILSQDGHYSLNLARATLPKIVAGARDKGTSEENKAIVGGAIFHYGKYTVDPQEKTITFNVEASSFPNWDGTAFKRPFKLSGDQLTYTNAAPSGGGVANDVVWTRIK